MSGRFVKVSTTATVSFFGGIITFSQSTPRLILDKAGVEQGEFHAIMRELFSDRRRPGVSESSSRSLAEILAIFMRTPPCLA